MATETVRDIKSSVFSYKWPLKLCRLNRLFTIFLVLCSLWIILYIMRETSSIKKYQQQQQQQQQFSSSSNISDVKLPVLKIHLVKIGTAPLSWNHLLSIHALFYHNTLVQDIIHIHVITEDYLNTTEKEHRCSIVKTQLPQTNKKFMSGPKLYLHCYHNFFSSIVEKPLFQSSSYFNEFKDLITTLAIDFNTNHAQSRKEQGNNNFILSSYNAERLAGLLLLQHHGGIFLASENLIQMQAFRPILDYYGQSLLIASQFDLDNTGCNKVTIDSQFIALKSNHPLLIETLFKASTLLLKKDSFIYSKPPELNPLSHVTTGDLIFDALSAIYQYRCAQYVPPFIISFPQWSKNILVSDHIPIYNDDIMIVILSQKFIMPLSDFTEINNISSSSTPSSSIVLFNNQQDVSKYHQILFARLPSN